MTIWVAPSVKEPCTAEVLADGKENAEWVVGKGGCKYQLQPCDQLQKVRLFLYLPYTHTFVFSPLLFPYQVTKDVPALYHSNLILLI